MIKFFKILFARFWVFQSVAFPVYLGSGAILKEARPSFNHKGEGRKKGFGMENRDLVIIGGGPAGYIAALRAVQYGIAPTAMPQTTEPLEELSSLYRRLIAVLEKR